MDQTTIGFMCLSAALAGALVYQSLTPRCPTVAAAAPARPAAKPSPPPAVPAKLEKEPPEPVFRPNTQRSIPADFRGDFAEDVHECGSSGMLKIAGREMSGPQGRELVEKVRLTAPRRIELDTKEAAASGLNRAYKMELSEDGDEITFIFTNMKRIHQRCSARAHD